MRIVLFKVNFFNPKQLLIALFTWSKVCHAGILFKGKKKIYDASESRGNVDWNKDIQEWNEQQVIVYEIPEDEIEAKKYALDKRGTRYDFKGIMGWFPFLASNDPQTVYCFELVLQTLLTFKTINGHKTKEIAGDLRQKLFKQPIDSDDIYVLMERSRLNPVYQGMAKDYR